MNNNKTTYLELLAPAKNSECGIAAINAGADAVYIGAPKFGARVNAGNTITDIEKVINYGHKFNVKTYVTVNTILYDNELEDAGKLIHELYNLGVDAVIIQDMGIMEMDLPPIPMFASTQCHNNSAEKILFLEKCGFKRVILARETTLNQIRDIKKNSTVDLEYFVHGALCVSYSGQCYFSQSVIGRSANRGECSQPCRMCYTLKNNQGRVIAKDKNLLSLKDLNLSDRLDDLIESGITSFKIEGRLKDIDYVTNVTAHYRKKIDKILQGTKNYKKSSSGISSYSFDPNPHKSFNRLFTQYFIDGRKEKVITFNYEKSLGEEIGKIKSVEPRHFTIDRKNDLINGDGICFFCDDVLFGTGINQIIGEKIFPNDMKNIQKGMIIYRNYDHAFVKSINSNPPKRNIPIVMDFCETDDGFILTAKDEDGFKSDVELSIPKLLAQNKNKSLEMINKQLAKSGDSIFDISEIRIRLNQPYFLQVSVLNNMRREALEKLEQSRISGYKRIEFSHIPNDFPYPVKELNYFSNISNKLAKQFYQRHGSIITEEAFELRKDYKNKIIMVTKHCLKYQFGFCGRYSKNPAEQSNEPWFLENNNKKYKLEFDCKECVMRVLGCSR